MRGLESKEEEKSSDIREIVCFGKELRSLIIILRGRERIILTSNLIVKIKTPNS